MREDSPSSTATLIAAATVLAVVALGASIYGVIFLSELLRP